MRVYELTDTGVTRRTLDGGLWDAMALARAAHDKGHTMVDDHGRDLAPHLPAPERGL